LLNLKAPNVSVAPSSASLSLRVSSKRTWQIGVQPIQSTCDCNVCLGLEPAALRTPGDAPVHVHGAASSGAAPLIALRAAQPGERSKHVVSWKVGVVEDQAE
jgi:hypothetical protein